MISHTAERTGFKVEDQAIEIIGLCPECQQTPNQPPEKVTVKSQ
jgi:Fe2+ or Zn2+ uptake regulation protein